MTEETGMRTNQDELARALRQAAQETVLSRNEARSEAEATWLRNQNALHAHLLREDPRSFLRWRVVADTMFASQPLWVAAELLALRCRRDWATRWRPALRESVVGDPPRLALFPDSSANLLHHAYHIAQYERVTGDRVHDLGTVVEFGGGYGSMCRLFRQLGFHGRYVIYDMPLFAALQRYYLRSMGIDVDPGGQSQNSDAGVTLVSSIDELRRIVSMKSVPGASLVVATWSLSESPIPLREAFAAIVRRFSSFLIAYQAHFGEVDNAAYFRNWKDRFDADMTWRAWRIPHIPRSRYLVGWMAT